MTIIKPFPAASSAATKPLITIKMCVKIVVPTTFEND